MGVIERLKTWRRQRLIKLLTLPEGTPTRTRLQRVWPLQWLRGDYTLQNSELLFSAVSRISNALSTMPIQLYKNGAAVKNDQNDLLAAEPNPSLTACQFIKTLEACRCTTGNAYALKIMDGKGGVERLDLLDPAKVRPILDQDSGELWYQVRTDRGEPFFVHNWYMIHIPFISTNGYTGVNPVSVLYDTINYSESIQAFSKSQLEQGVNAAIVLEAPANLGEAQKTAMVNSFMENYRETNGNILLLESGVTARSLNLSPVDTKLFEVEKITRSKVAMVYNLPPHLLGDYSDTSFSSQEQQMLEFLQLTMLPIVTAYEQEFDRKLLTRAQRKKGLHYKFDMNALLRADASTMAEVNYKAVRSAWKTVNEIRAENSLPPLAAAIGDVPMISQDLATLQYSVADKPRLALEAAERSENNG